MSAGVGSNASAALAHIQPSVSRVWVTPFTGPVLPDVKKIAAGSTARRRARHGAVRTAQLLERRAVTHATFEPDDAVREHRRGGGGEVGGAFAVGHVRRGPAHADAWSISGGAYR